MHVTINCPDGVRSLEINGRLAGGLWTNNRSATLYLGLNHRDSIGWRLNRMFTWDGYGFNTQPGWQTKARRGCAFLFTLNRRGPFIEALQHCVY